MPNKQLRRFYLERVIDDSGVSGTGKVALGVLFPSGRVCIEWCSEKTPVSANTIYQTVDEMLTVHGHEGHTQLVWDDEGTLDVAARDFIKMQRGERGFILDSRSYDALVSAVGAPVAA